MPDAEDKGYTVKDRRFHQLSEEEKAEARGGRVLPGAGL